MATGQGVNEYITLSDFTPGIFGDYRSDVFGSVTGEAAPDGAAQMDGTWGCVGAPGGGLVPLPARTEAGTQASIVDAEFGVDYGPHVTPADHILDTFLMSPVSPPYSEEVSNSGPYPDYLFVLYESYYEYGAFPGAGRAFFLMGYKRHTNPEVAFLVDYDNYAPIATIRDLGFGTIDGGRTWVTGDALTPGNPVVVYTMGRDDDGGFKVANFPDAFNAASILTDVPVDLDNTYIYQFVITHQGRAVYCRIIGANGNVGGREMGDSTVVPVAEELVWSSPNEIQTLPLPATGTIFVEENPSGYGSWVSMNAGELFLVKNRGGAVVVRGDIDNPTVIRLPGVASSYGRACKGVVTPFGYIYGTRHGVWAWNGGDTSELISPQIDGDFWVNEAMTDDQNGAWRMGQPLSKFAYAHPYVLVGNGFVLDTRTKGWFRLCDPDASDIGPGFAFYEVSATGRFYAITPHNGDDDLIYQHFNPEVGAYSYSWHSQPIQRTKGRKIKLREIVLTAQGTRSTITVTVTGIDGATDSAQFLIDSEDRPVTVSAPISVHSHDVEVLIEASGDSPSWPDAAVAGTEYDTAPRIYRVQLGFREEGSVGS